MPIEPREAPRSPRTPSSSARGTPSTPGSQGSARPLSGLAYVGYYLLLFFAYWFGSNRFDADGDGDFDPEDVQLFLADMGIVTRNFKKSKKGKKQPGSPGATPSNRKKREGDAAADGSPAGGPTPARRPPPEGGRSAGGSIFDLNGDGEVDLQDFLESNVKGEAVEDYIRNQQRWPVFIMTQTLVALLFWFGGAIHASSSQNCDFLSCKAGIDTFSPGWSDLRLFGPLCQDWRGEVWRTLTYQLTHVGVSHILMNCFMNLILGIPLEGLHGPLRMLCMYNAGVFGGAIWYWIGDAHKNVVGMSGGCYALIGMHVADLLLNWKQVKFRKPIVVFLVVLITVDVLAYVLALGASNASHTAHLGGAAMGVLIGVIFGKNLVVKRCERVMQGLCIFIAAAWIIFCVAWMASHDPPKSIAEADGYCWVRQVWNPAKLHSDQWICVKCGSEACVADYAGEKYMETVALSACTAFVEGR